MLFLSTTQTSRNHPVKTVTLKTSKVAITNPFQKKMSKTLFSMMVFLCFSWFFCFSSSYIFLVSRKLLPSLWYRIHSVHTDVLVVHCWLVFFVGTMYIVYLFYPKSQDGTIQLERIHYSTSHCPASLYNHIYLLMAWNAAQINLIHKEFKI